LQVWRGGAVSRYVPGQVAVDALRDITPNELRHKTFGAPAPEPELGRSYRLPRRPDRQPTLRLDDSLPTVRAPTLFTIVVGSFTTFSQGKQIILVSISSQENQPIAEQTVIKLIKLSSSLTSVRM
jgi:hypothetical protein